MMQKISSPARFYPVKMSMEVSFTTHSHIIGRAGASINAVMKETTTKIHFPDQNRVAGEKKSNEVTISGELINVEMARRRIRLSIPVEYVVECRTETLDSYGRQTLVKDFAVLYGVLLRMNDRTTDAYSCSATIRGSQQEIDRLKEAVNHLLRLNHNKDAPVSMKIEVSTEQLKTLRSVFSHLEMKFSTTFFVIKLGVHEDHQTIWIRGSVEAVYLAKLALTELLPLKLMFHVHAIHLNFGVNERKLAKRLDVTVKMEPSTKPNSFLLQIIGYEKNAGNIYEFRRQILRLPVSSEVSTLGLPVSVPPLTEFEPASIAVQFTTHKTVAPEPRFRQAIDEDQTVETVLPSIQSKLFESPKELVLPSSELLFCRSSIDDKVTMPASMCAMKFDKNSYRQLCELLIESDLSEYCDLFLANEVDLALFTTLCDDDLKSIGVLSYRARRFMLHLIGELKNQPITCPNDDFSKFHLF